jgi:hypothetical protein
MALAISVPTHAADNSESIKTLPLKDIMSSLDRNQNGCIEEEEGRNYTSRRFHLMDSNGDGQLDASEAPPAADDTTAMRPIGVEAWQDAYHARFGALDADASGCLSPDEITQGRARNDASKGEG